MDASMQRPAGRASGSQNGSGVSWSPAAFSSRGMALPMPVGIFRYSRLEGSRLEGPRFQRPAMARNLSCAYALLDPHESSLSNSSIFIQRSALLARYYTFNGIDTSMSILLNTPDNLWI